jgi:hypothetical protein
MINWIKSKLKREPRFKNYPELRAVFAFSSGGVDYFELEDSNDLNQGRGFAALNYYKELSMSCTRPFLVAHTTAIDKIVRNPKTIDIIEVAKLNLQLKERTELIIDSLTPYKVASVIFFDKTENPYSFDYAYALKKIEKWKKESVSSFFLQQPLKSLIPSSLWSEENLESYMKIAREIDLEHYQTILSAASRVLSEKEMNSDWWKELKLEKSLI